MQKKRMQKTEELISNQNQIQLSNLIVRGKTWITYWVIMALFIIVKAVLRPHFKDSSSELVLIFLYSFPNFAEAYIGTFAISGMLVIGRMKGFSLLKSLQDRSVYIISVILAAVFVITQELNFHALGGENITDVYDIVFSLLGLGFTFLMLSIFGTGIKSRDDL